MCSRARAFSLETPLQLAVDQSAMSGAGHLNALRLLLDAGADMNVTDCRRVTDRSFIVARTHFTRSGSTPLHAACIAGDTAVAQLLLDAKADVGARNAR